MSLCPHCGKEKDDQTPQKGTWPQVDPNNTQVTLGCSTLILIAIIVSMFSNSGGNSDEVRRLKNSIQNLESKIDRMSQDIKQLR